MGSKHWEDEEYVKASGEGSNQKSKFLSVNDLKQGMRILKYVERKHQEQGEVKNPEAKSADGMVWNYWFTDLTDDEKGVERCHSPYGGKPNSALTIQMKTEGIEPGDVFTASAKGEGKSLRCDLVILSTPQAVEEAKLKANQKPVETDLSNAPF